MFDWIASSLRLATPLLFAAMGGLLCERAGIATICLEGVMLVAAFTAAATTFYFGNPWVGMCAGLLAGMIAMLLHAFLSVTAKSDRIISAVAINILAAGMTPFLCKVFFTSATNTAALSMENRLPAFPIMALALILPFIVNYFLKRTSWGMWLSSAGDGPKALETCGIPVSRVRYAALAAGGLLTSLGGIYLATCHASQFTRDMTAGRGFIALAALIFGKWKPIPTLFACLFFGLTDSLQIQLQSVTFQGFEVPVQLLQALPYLITLFVLVGFVGEAKPPAAILKNE